MDRTVGVADRAMGRSALLWGLGIALAIACGSPWAALEVPFLAGHVNDQAGLLDHQQGVALENRLAEFEERTGHQVVVLTLPSLEGENLEEYSLRVAETWHLGRAQQDDGVLLLIAKNDRKLRIEVGYGLEGELTDALSKRIIDERIVPRFKEGDFPGGVDDGVSSILGLIEGDPQALPEVAHSVWAQNSHSFKGILTLLGITVFLLMTLGTFSAMALVVKGGGGWFLYLFLIPFNSLFPMAIYGSRVGAVIAVAWIFGAPILRLLLPKTKVGARWREKIGPMSMRGSGGSSRGGYSGGSDYSGGGSDYSGGGGSFGGGGASGSW